MSTTAIAAARVAEQHRWTPGQTDVAKREYERFVALADAHPGVPLVPSVAVDLVWHEHMGMVATTGEPSAPAHRPDDITRQAERFALTRQLYAERFGPPGDMWAAAADCQVDEPAEFAVPD